MTQDLTAALDLEAQLYAAIRRRYADPKDLGAPVDDEDVAELEASVGVRLPEDFRRFCTHFADFAPCPYTPVDTSAHPFEIELDQRDGTHDSVGLLWGFGASSAARLRRPFPFKARWKGPVSLADVDGRIPTQASPDAYLPSRSFEGVPAGATPHDGWLDLWGDLQYCDVWRIGYGLVVSGPARGQVWLSSMQCGLDFVAPATLLLRPIARSFVDWAAMWNGLIPEVPFGG